MKIYVMNGWKECPELWKGYLVLPFAFEYIKHHMIMLGLFGFAIFFVFDMAE